VRRLTSREERTGPSLFRHLISGPHSSLRSDLPPSRRRRATPPDTSSRVFTARVRLSTSLSSLFTSSDMSVLDPSRLSATVRIWSDFTYRIVPTPSTTQGVLMPLPDPYANEPTADVDPHTYRLFMEAQDAIKQWEKEAARLKELLIKEIGDAHAGLVDGHKLIYYRPTDRWAEARLIKDNPDLVQHYIKPKVTDTFDMNSFMSSHPDIADKYRVRSFRSLSDI